MSDYLKTFVQETLKKTVKEEYPHIQYPGIVLGKIVDIKEEQTYRVLTLSILDKDQNDDPEYPRIPYVCTTLDAVIGETLVLGMLYGNCVPYVIGRYPDDH